MEAKTYVQKDEGWPVKITVESADLVREEDKVTVFDSYGIAVARVEFLHGTRFE